MCYTFASITVAASNKQDRYWDGAANNVGSNYGPCVDVFAPVSVETYMIYQCVIYLGKYTLYYASDEFE